MTDPIPLSRLDQLVLAALTGAKPPSPSELTKRLTPLAFAASSRLEARQRTSAALAALVERGLVDGQRRLTDEGRRALCAALRVTRVPTWQQATGKLVPALAMRLAPESAEAARALKDGQSLQLEILRARHDLGEARNVSQLGDTLLARALGLPPGKKLTLQLLRTHVLAQLLGEPARGKDEDLVKRVAAAAVRARKTDAGSLKQALVRRWLAEPGPHGSEASPSQDRPAAERRADEPLRDSGDTLDRALLALVQEVLPLLRAPDRFGPDKVFLSALWSAVRAHPRCPPGLAAEPFRRWLLRANQRQLLTLARADLVGAMDEQRVAASELQHDGAEFHFVLDPRATAKEE